MKPHIIAIPIDRVDADGSIYYYKLNHSSTIWEKSIKEILRPGTYEQMHFLGPTGVPVVSSVYVAFSSLAQKCAGDLRLAASGLGQFSDQDPFLLGEHITMFLRPDFDWQVEMPGQGRA